MKFVRSSDLCQQKVECPQLTSRKGEKSCESSWCNWISISMLRCYLRKIYTVLKAGNRKKKVSLCWFVQHSFQIRTKRKKMRSKVTLLKVGKTNSIAVVVTSHLLLKSFEISFVVVFAIQSYEKNCLFPFSFSHFPWFFARYLWALIVISIVMQLSFEGKYHLVLFLISLSRLLDYDSPSMNILCSEHSNIKRHLNWNPPLEAICNVKSFWFYIAMKFSGNGIEMNTQKSVSIIWLKLFERVFFLICLVIVHSKSMNRSNAMK